MRDAIRCTLAGIRRRAMGPIRWAAVAVWLSGPAVCVALVAWWLS